MQFHEKQGGMGGKIGLISSDSITRDAGAIVSERSIMQQHLLFHESVYKMKVDSFMGKCPRMSLSGAQRAS